MTDDVTPTEHETAPEPAGTEAAGSPSHDDRSARLAADAESDQVADAGPPQRNWPIGLTALGFGGDYNPEQWSMAVRLEDISLMREAGVNVVSLAIFAWASIEPREGRYEWEWLDNMMDRLQAAGVKVALATATAAPPPWLTANHPEILPKTANGVVLHQGSRQAYAPTSVEYIQYAVKMATAMAQRYADHPALALWHIDNEIGCHVPHDYSDSAVRAFKTWLRRKYRTVDRLNEAWGTAFWSQRYSAFRDVLPPVATPSFVNPTQQLDFARFSSESLLTYYKKLRDAVRPITPHVPITTNFMVNLTCKWMDYFAWAEHMDVVANDHYTIAADSEREIDLAFAADMTRGVAGGKPWILMEHSTAAVNWQVRNCAKAPGEMLRNSLAHVARGADSVFFQFRQAKVGAERFHSALVPHAGTDSAVWRESVRLGEVLTTLGNVVGSRVRAKAAIVMDYQAWWACEQEAHPNNDLKYPERIRAWYGAFWRRGVTIDVVHPSADLDGYHLIVVPNLYLVTDENAANISAAAERGATVVITFFSGIVDENAHVRLGGYPGAFRELLGVRTDEFFPLMADEQVTLDDGTTADLWTERVAVTTAKVVRSFTDGPLPGGPAVTRRSAGAGAAWYVATRQDEAGTAELVEQVLAESGVHPEAETVPGVEVVRRHGADASYLFVLNHTGGEARVCANGTDLVSGAEVDQAVTVPAGGVAVVAEA